MSLKGGVRFRMLRIERQREEWRAVEPGTDPGVSGSQRGSRVCGSRSEGGLQLDQLHAMRAGVLEAEQSDQGLVRLHVQKMTGLSRAQVTRSCRVREDGNG